MVSPDGFPVSSGKAMDALMSNEGFRNLNQDIETTINKSETVNKELRNSSNSLRGFPSLCT